MTSVERAVVYSKQKQRCWKLSELRLSALLADSEYSPSVEVASSGQVVVVVAVGGGIDSVSARID